MNDDELPADQDWIGSLDPFISEQILFCKTIFPHGQYETREDIRNLIKVLGLDQNE